MNEDNSTNKKQVIIMFPRHTTEKSNFTDPADNDGLGLGLLSSYSRAFPPRHTIPTPVQRSDLPFTPPHHPP
jgi:hypothetical protein